MKHTPTEKEKENGSDCHSAIVRADGSCTACEPAEDEFIEAEEEAE